MVTQQCEVEGDAGKAFTQESFHLPLVPECLARPVLSFAKIWGRQWVGPQPSSLSLT